MTEQERINLLNRAKDFFREEVVNSHITKACKSAGKLSNYNVNPFLFKYLANFLTGNDDPGSMAEALVYPRLLGSSITTSFGMKIQKLISQLFQGFGSTTSGIDVEFIDAIDGRKKYCQLKSGPNTINKDDVITIVGNFQSTISLARMNNLNIAINDLVVGVIYGETGELSSHYRKLKRNYPVWLVRNFGIERITGKDDFYFDLIESLGEVAIEVDGTEKLENTINSLAAEIEEKFMTH